MELLSVMRYVTRITVTRHTYGSMMMKCPPPLARRFWHSSLPILHRLEMDQICRLAAAVASLDRRWRRERSPQTTSTTNTSTERPGEKSLSEALLNGKGGISGRQASLVPDAWAAHTLQLLEQRLRHSMRESTADKGSDTPDGLSGGTKSAGQAGSDTRHASPLSAKQLLQLTWVLAEVPPLWPERPLRSQLLIATKALLSASTLSLDPTGSSGGWPPSGREATRRVTLDQLSQLPLRLAVAGMTRDVDKCDFFSALMIAGDGTALRAMTDRQVSDGTTLRAMTDRQVRMAATDGRRAPKGPKVAL